MVRTSIFLALMSLIAGCSYQPEDAGLCKLNCSQAVITSNDNPLKFLLQTPTPNFTCGAAAAGQVIPDPFVVQFKVTEAFDNGTDTAGQRPVPFVSIEPVVMGLRSEQPEHNPNVEINNGVFTPARYKGIITPKDNWCTDTCGVVTLEIAAVCPGQGASSDLTIQMHSGALYSDVAVFPTNTLSQ